jgi:hypothetical protein
MRKIRRTGSGHKQRSEAFGVAPNEAAAEALRGSLDHVPAKPVAKFRLVTVRGKLARPDIDLDHTAALITAEDEAIWGQGSLSTLTAGSAKL